MPATVLDAPALLAYLQNETGAEVVTDAIAEGTTISTVNLSEVLTRVADRGGDPSDLMVRMTESGLIDGAVKVEAFTDVDALNAASLRTKTRAQGLSLGDRACIALAQRLELPVLTADSAWAQLDLDVELRQIRRSA